MAERTKIFGVLAKIETTSGTDAAPTAAANAVRVIGIPQLTIDYIEQGFRPDENHGGFGQLQRAPVVGRFGTVDITLPLVGAGAAVATAQPSADVFWRASGFYKATSGAGATEMTGYGPIDTGTFETMTLWLYTASQLYKLTGCVCQPKVSLEATKRGTVTFSVTGVMNQADVDVALPAMTLNSTIPPLFHSKEQKLMGYDTTTLPTLRLQKVDIDFGIAVTPLVSAGATSGLIGYQITDRNTTMSATIHALSLAAFNWTSLLLGSGVTQPSYFQIGSAQYNSIVVDVGGCMLTPQKLDDDSGIMTATFSGPIVARSLVGSPFGETNVAAGREFAITYK